MLSVRVHKRESDKAKEIRKSSHAYMKEQEDKEAWQAVSFLGPEAEESKMVLESLISPSGRDIDFGAPSIDYLSTLNAITKSRDDGVPAQVCSSRLRLSFPFSRWHTRCLWLQLQLCRFLSCRLPQRCH